MSEDQKMSLLDTIAPKSDQLNFDDVASTPRTVRVTGMAQGSPEQPVILRVVDATTGAKLRDYKPSKGMRRVLVQLWGTSGKTWIGKFAKLIGDPTVKFGKDTVGGIRIAAVSGITAATTVLLTVGRGRRSEVVIQPLADIAVAEQSAEVRGGE